MATTTVDPPEARSGRSAFLRGALPYAIAYAVYVPLCVAEPRLMLSWAEGIGFLVVAVWALPALVGVGRRLTREPAASAESPRDER